METPSSKLHEAVQQALQTLAMQNERLEEFHKQSLRWHKQHNELLVEIGDLVRKAKQTVTTPIVEPEKALPEMVDDLLAKGDTEGLRSALQRIGLGQWKSFGDVRFARLLPYLTAWLRDSSMSRPALSMIYEGTKMWGEVLSHPSNAPVHSSLVTALQALSAQPSDVREDILDLLHAVEGYRASTLSMVALGDVESKAQRSSYLAVDRWQHEGEDDGVRYEREKVDSARDLHGRESEKEIHGRQDSRTRESVSSHGTKSSQGKVSTGKESTGRMSTATSATVVSKRTAWSLSPPPSKAHSRSQSGSRGASPSSRLYPVTHASHCSTTLMERSRGSRKNPPEKWGPLGELQQQQLHMPRTRSSSRDAVRTAPKVRSLSPSVPSSTSSYLKSSTGKASSRASSLTRKKATPPRAAHSPVTHVPKAQYMLLQYSVIMSSEEAARSTLMWAEETARNKLWSSFIMQAKRRWGYVREPKLRELVAPSTSGGCGAATWKEHKHALLKGKINSFLSRLGDYEGMLPYDVRNQLKKVEKYAIGIGVHPKKSNMEQWTCVGDITKELMVMRERAHKTYAKELQRIKSKRAKAEEARILSSFGRERKRITAFLKSGDAADMMKAKTTEQINDGKTMTASNEQMLEALQSKWDGIFCMYKGKQQPRYKQFKEKYKEYITGHEMECSEITCADLREVLKKTKGNHSCGVDGWRFAEIEALPDTLLEGVASLLNAIERTGIWPEPVLTALVQGCPLSAVLINALLSVLVADMEESTDAIVTSYADDLTAVSKEGEKPIQEAMNVAKMFCMITGMIISKPKTLTFSTKKGNVSRVKDGEFTYALTKAVKVLTSGPQKGLERDRDGKTARSDTTTIREKVVDSGTEHHPGSPLWCFVRATNEATPRRPKDSSDRCSMGTQVRDSFITDLLNVVLPGHTHDPVMAAMYRMLGAYTKLMKKAPWFEDVAISTLPSEVVMMRPPDDCVALSSGLDPEQRQTLSRQLLTLYDSLNGA